MATRLLIAVLLLLAACAAPPDEPRWTRAESVPGAVDGWDGGFLAAGDTLAVSNDGRAWRPTEPVRIRTHVATAAHGAVAHVLGWTATALIVWRTEDGDHWRPSVLRETAPDAKLELAMAAGPRGVIVVASDPEHAGITVWHSPDGHSFGPPAPLPEAAAVVPRSELMAVATPDGFLVVPGLGLGSESVPVENVIRPPALYASPDGVDWSDIGPGMPEGRVEGMSGNGSTVVVVTQAFDSTGQQLWFHRDGVWRRAGIDPGRLGDPAVLPAAQRVLDEIRHWGDGFLAVGHVSTADAANGTSYVWTSATGSGWNRLPHTIGTVRDIAVSGSTTLLTGEVESWISHAPPVFAATPPEPPPPTSGPPKYAHDIPVYDPWSERFPPAAGTAHCEFESAVTERHDAWECTANGATYDPCFLHPAGLRVACWSSREAVVFSVPEPLLYEDLMSAIEWRMDLATGDICTTYTGAPVFNGREPLWMVCQPGKQARYVWSWVSETEIQTSTTIDGELTHTKVIARYR
ncbi:hypothetical protein ACTG9Q_22475 [Actinokineospora sp. 24-640]